MQTVAQVMGAGFGSLLSICGIGFSGGIQGVIQGFIFGCNVEVELADGSKAAVNNAYLEVTK